MNNVPPRDKNTVKLSTSSTASNRGKITVGGSQTAIIRPNIVLPDFDPHAKTWPTPSDHSGRHKLKFAKRTPDEMRQDYVSLQLFPNGEISYRQHRADSYKRPIDENQERKPRPYDARRHRQGRRAITGALAQYDKPKPVLITLTTPEVVELSDFRRMVKSYWQWQRRNLKDSPEYISAIELQERGAPHLHILQTTGYSSKDFKLLVKKWNQLSENPHGNGLDGKALKRRNASARQVTNYLSKTYRYALKTLNDGTQVIPRSTVISQNILPFAKPIEELRLNINHPIYGKLEELNYFNGNNSVDYEKAAPILHKMGIRFDSMN